MKTWRNRVIALAIICGLLSMSGLGLQGRTAEAAPPEELRGVWIASVYNINFPSKQTLTTAQMRQELSAIVQDAKELGLNAIFFQVRPTADALYVSDLYPWSQYLTGQQGQGPAGSFDPLQYLIQEAKKNQIQVHAWINPYKITRGSAAKPNWDVTKLDVQHPARKYPDLVVAHSSGELYFNPGEPMSRYLVLQGVQELLNRYAIDGIHYDDYFYPTGSFDDQATYAKYGKGYKTIEDWRRHNVDLLIQQTNQLVHRKPGVVFGVSPAGVWANSTSHLAGSDTKAGVETYYDHYADTRKWIQQGWVDYIAPQIYWQIGHSQCDYATLVDWWSRQVQNTNVKLYIGHAAYKMGEAAQGTAWTDGEELARQIAYNRTKATVSGSIFYGYGAIQQNIQGTRESIAAAMGQP